MKQLVEYKQEGAQREAERLEESVGGVLNRAGQEGWEAWHMEDILLPDGRPSNHVRIYFQRRAYQAPWA